MRSLIVSTLCTLFQVIEITLGRQMIHSVRFLRFRGFPRIGVILLEYRILVVHCYISALVGSELPGT